MILLFPNLDTLRLALTSSIVSTDVTLSPASVSFDDQGKIYLEANSSLSRTTTRNLDRIGVKGSKRHASDKPEVVSCWPQVAPLLKEPGTPVVSNQAPVIFELSHADDLPILVTEMLRLGNDRQSFRWYNAADEPEGNRVLLRVIGPPYYTLLRALDPSAAGTRGAVRAYLERAPRVWVELGYAHPLAQQVRVAEGQFLLMRSPREWTYLEETPFQDVYEVLQFKLPHAPADWTEAAPLPRMTVPLRLAAGNAADVPELWVLREHAVEQLDTLVRDSDDRLTQRLKFAVAADSQGNRIIIIRTIPSKLPPPALPLENVPGFKPFWKLPNLFVPVGRRLHPTLRRDAVRKLLADDPDQVVWLYPGADGGFIPESVPDGAFQSLENWVSYVIEAEQKPLAAWIEATRFDFDHFTCKEPTGPKNKPDKGDKDKPREGTDEGKAPKGTTPRGPAKPRAAGPRAAAEFLPEAEATRAPSEWVKRRTELEEQFKAIEGGLDAPERQKLWPELANANAHAGDSKTEAAICWLNAMWSTDPVPAAWAAAWARSELPQIGNGLKADEFDKRLAANVTSQEEARATVAAFLFLASQSPVPGWLPARLAGIQAYLEKNEGALPVRAVWLASYRLAQLAGADVLGLARVRDRLLQRLLEQGLTAERDLPMFLRVAGLKDSERLRVVNEKALELHRAVRRWTEHIPVNLPYVDLLFAFALAKLGETSKARALVEDARKVMEVPIPTTWADHKQSCAVIAAATSNFLFKAFKYRVDQVLAGKPSSGPMSAELFAELESVAAKARTSGTNNPFGQVEYVIARMREQSRIIEPQERLDPYSYWTKNQDAFKKRLADLQAIHEPGHLKLEIYKALNDRDLGKNSEEVQFKMLHGALPLAPRAGEAFAKDLLKLVPKSLGWFAGAQVVPEFHSKQGELLERALFLAGHFDQGLLAKELVDKFSELIRSKPQDVKLKLINAVAGQCLRSLKKLGMRDEIDRFLGRLRNEVLHGAALEELRSKYAAKPEIWGSVLQTLQSLASGWLTFGLHDQAKPLLDAARFELLNPHAVQLAAKDYTPLARAYVTASGQCPSDAGLARITEFFRNMESSRITNTWTTAQFYSRFHLNLVEDVVQALVSDEFTLGATGRRWLDDDEYLVRHRIHADMKRERLKSGL